MTPGYVFVLLVTMISSEPTPVIIQMRTHETIEACETAGKLKVAELLVATPGRQYVFNCLKFQTG